MAMMQYWPAIVFGWPSALLGAALLVAAIARRAFAAGIAGAILATGICAYASLAPPPLRWLGIVALGGNVASALAVRRGALTYAVVGLIPYVLLLVMLAVAVLRQ